MTTHEIVLPLFAQPAGERKRYPTIVADPPWQYEQGAHRGGHRGATDYPTMTMEELYMLPVGAWAADDAHLYLWTTNAFMVQAHTLAKAWGFEPKMILTWVKGRVDGSRLVQHMGVGMNFRGSTEHVIFCGRGSLSVQNHDVPTAFLAPRTEHSEKPAAFYDMVEHMSPGPYLDVFSRKQRFNWDTWGNEAFDFNDHGIWHDKASGK